MKMISTGIMLAGVMMAGCATHSSEKVVETKRETLARHETRAEFLGIEDHVCRGLTALCPDQCGHSGSLARFKIVEYIHFESFSEYGKEQDHFDLLVKDNLGHLKVDQILADTIDRFSPGDIEVFSPIR